MSTDTEALQALNLASGGSPNPPAKQLATSASGTLKWKSDSDMYDAPRRSLRQKGLRPEEKGFPYYSPSKLTTPTRLGKRRRSQEDMSDSDADTAGGPSGEKTGQTSPTSVLSKEPEDIYMDADNELDEQPRGLTNASVRRQIIRPWEDSREAGSTSESPYTVTDKQNGVMSSPDDSRIRRNSGVQTAAEALVAEALVAMATPTKEGTCDESVGGSDDYRSGQRSEMCNGPTDHSLENPQAIVDGKGLVEVYEKIVRGTEGCSVEVMERIHNTYQQLVFRHRMNWQRENLLEVS